MSQSTVRIIEETAIHDDLSLPSIATMEPTQNEFFFDGNVDMSIDGDGDGEGDNDDDTVESEVVTRETVIQRIEDLVLSQAILEPLERMQIPSIGAHKTLMHTTYCRLLTSVILIADFCHDLLQSQRTTTIREVYYHFVTHFRNQAECDKAIWDLAEILMVPRSALGLAASPKGWCCGSLELYDAQDQLIWNGRSLDVHGIAITTPLKHATIRAYDAKCILVVEKEGIYNRLSEDKIFQQYPCILVTGKGFPDIATRQWVHHLHRVLRLPVYALCDANPYGISVLQTYQYTQKANLAIGKNSSRSGSLDIKWLGLRPSQLCALNLPPTVFQQLTVADHKRLDSLMNESSLFCQQGNSSLRMQELREMKENGYKVELEALNWLGMDYLCQWVRRILEQHEEALASEAEWNSSYII